MKLSLNFTRTLFHRLRERYLWLEGKVERLRERVPGLPRARVLLSIAGLLMIAGVLFGAVQVLLGPRQAFGEYTLPYVQNFDDVNLRRWFTHKGVWTIRDQTLAQTIGGDEAGQLHLPFKLPADQSYHVSVLITLKKDTRAAGLVFNSQYPDMTEKQHRVYISHPQKDRLELVSGNTDESGSFIPQAQIPLDVNSQEFRLDVFVYDTTYIVMLNGQRLIEKRPLVYKDGLIGFYSLGPAMFDTFKLTAADTPNPGNLVYTSDFDQDNGGAGWVPFNGTWRISDKELRQSDPKVSEAGIAYETSTFQNYTLRATLHHTAGVGAGVMFNMPSPYQLNGAQVVRFSDETDALLWGFYDEQGVFERQGYAPVEPISQTTQTLQIYSGESSYDILLNDVLLARNVPMTQTQGHVGLVTSHAAAGFTQIDVFPLFGSNAVSESQQLKPVVSSPTPMTATLKITTTAKLTATVVPKLTSRPVTATLTVSVTPPSRTPVATGTPLPEVTRVQSQQPLTSTATSQLTAPVSISLPITPTSRPTLPPTSVVTSGAAGGLIYQPTIKPSAQVTVASANATTKPAPIVVGTSSVIVTPTHTITLATTITASKPMSATSVVVSTPDTSSVSATATALPIVSATITATAPITSSAKLVEGKPYRADFTGELSQQGWQSLSGEWHFENGKMLQSNTTGSDLCVVYTRTAFKRYSMSVSFAHSQSSGAGLIFNIPNRDRLAGAHMVRYSERRSNALIWGYYDADGRFKGQGFADVEPAGTDTHNLRVVVNDTDFAIFLDDKQIIDKLPLQNNGGYIGLLTTKSAAVYDQVEVDKASAPAKPTRKVVDTFGNVRSLNGNWAIADGVFTQSVPNVADYMVNLGEAGQVFTASMRITLPDPADPANANVGGGFIFHMGDRGSKRNAYVVRLREGGKGIWWGATDDTGRFQGQGSAPITTTARSFNLKLYVNSNQLTIYLDNKLLISNITMDRNDGWLGLLAYGGPVVFDQVRIDLETHDPGAPGV